MNESDKDHMEVTTEAGKEKPESKSESSHVSIHPNSSSTDITTANSTEPQPSNSESFVANDPLSATIESTLLDTSSHPASNSDQKPAGARPKQQVGVSKGKEPVCLLILGMAGSGKTSLLRRLDAHLNVRQRHYTINLDPAVDNVPYVSYIDIRDTVNYKEVCV